jgi:DNA-binding NarL/FixJ family response regulator
MVLAVFSPQPDHFTLIRIAEKASSSDRFCFGNILPWFFPGGGFLEKARVLLAAPHRLVREALGRAIDQEENITLVGSTDDSLEAYRLAREHRPDVILFDLDSSRMDWANFVRELSVSCRGVRFLALSPDGDIQRISSLCEAGIHGCVCFSSPFSELVRGLRKVLDGDLFFDQGVSDGLPEVLSRINEGALLLRGLTAREREVVYLVSQGFSNQQIAREMVLSEKTVKNHISHILRKLDLKDRTQVAILAWKTGLAVNGPA